MTCLGAILAGGASRRFGSDKALALWNGQSLLAHGVANLAPHVDAIIICGRDRGPEGIVCIPDFPAADLGPLGGLCAALRHAAAHGHDRVLSIGCDTPLLAPDLLARLAAPDGDRHLIQSPVIGGWRAVHGESLAQHLIAGGDRSVRRWAQAIGAEPVDAGADIPNLNAPADLAALARQDRDHDIPG